MSKTTNTNYTAEDIKEALLSMADSRQAIAMQRFFKTSPGEYGEGDRFVGLKNPQVRHVVKEAWKNTSLQDAIDLAKSPMHEVRLCGLLIMVEKYLKAMKEKDRLKMHELYCTYLELYPWINNWDLVDLSAIKIVGNHEVLIQSESLSSGTESRSAMDLWIFPGHTLWQQRISMVSTWMLIRKGMPEFAFRRAATLLESQHDLLHKAAGWMLREAWKHGYKEELREFLDATVRNMPAIMLSYACEQMSLPERQSWQRLRKSSS